MSKQPRVYAVPEGGVAIISVDYVVFENEQGTFLGFKVPPAPEPSEIAA